MGIRENLRDKPAIGWAAAGALVLISVGVLARTYWPERKADTSRVWYTDDDGQTWFADSGTLLPPFERNGKTVVVAEVYSYAGGGKKFCAYLAKFKPEAKKQLEDSQAEAKRAGKPPEAAAVYRDPRFMSAAMLVKKPGPGNEWVPQDDPKAIDVLTIKSPDGSAVDQVLVY